LVNDYYKRPSGTTRREFIHWVTVFGWQFSLNRLPGHQRGLGPTNSRRRDGWPTRYYYDCVRTNQTDPLLSRILQYLSFTPQDPSLSSRILLTTKLLSLATPAVASRWRVYIILILPFFVHNSTCIPSMYNLFTYIN